MAIGAQQAAIRAVIASALAEQVSESGQSVDALVAIRRAEAIIKALELAGYEIKPRTRVTAMACAVERRRFPVGASPTRRPLPAAPLHARL